MPESGAGFAGQLVAVIGLGRSGTAAGEALLRVGARVVVIDERCEPRHDAAAEQLARSGADVRRGVSELPRQARLVVTSPGVAPHNRMLAQARAAGVEVIGEPELAWRLRPAGSPDWLGITGTNGKTTTVGMLEAILVAAGYRAVAAGNIGLPLVRAVTTEPGYDVLAVEVSSFQLAQSPSIRFPVAAILNIAPDHLDWHGSFEAYRDAKLRIWRGARAIGNLDDPVVAAALPDDGIGFTLRSDGAGYRVADGALRAPDGTELADVAALPARELHNLSNALAAAAVATTWGVPAAAVADGLGRFHPGPHRAQVVATGRGITWIDDSKATNPHAAAASLRAHRSVVWIAGGLLKGADVDALIAGNVQRLRAVVLIGGDRAPFATALRRHAPGIPVVEVAALDTGAMRLAVDAAARLARPGDVVLLAPAAASWDLFADYAQRGELFAAAARAAAS